MSRKYVAYSDLGKGSGAPVDPDEFGGEDSEDFKYMLERRTVVPLGDPDAPAPPDNYVTISRAEYEATRAAAEAAVGAKDDVSGGSDTSSKEGDGRSDSTGLQPTRGSSPATSSASSPVKPTPTGAGVAGKGGGQ